MNGRKTGYAGSDSSEAGMEENRRHEQTDAHAS